MRGEYPRRRPTPLPETMPTITITTTTTTAVAATTQVKQLAAVTLVRRRDRTAEMAMATTIETFGTLNQQIY